MSRAKSARRRRLEGRLIQGVVQLFARLPLPLLHWLGARLGDLINRVPNRQRRNATINLALCFPDASRSELEALRKANLRGFATTFLETPYLWLRSTDKVLGLIRDVNGAQLLQRRDGEGLIVLSPHIGAWELAGLHLSMQGPTAIFYKPQKYLDDLIVHARGRGGAELAPITARGVRALVQMLQQGGYAGVLPDQEPGQQKGAVFAPLFGVSASTMLLVRNLARKTHARVVFLFAERLTSGGGFRLHCLAAPDGIDSDDDAEAAAALNRGIEACIAVCPEQYLWSYKRFRRLPEGLPELYTGGSRDDEVWAHVQRLRPVLAAMTRS